MHSIKFRAWDIITKKMCPVWGINFKAWDRDSFVINYVQIEIDGTVDRLENEVHLMQFTRLHDKNEKEIYFDDIVEKYGIKFIVDEMIVSKWIIDMNKANDPDVKIIGNIYENQNLIG